MEERRVAEYFVVAGLPANPTPLREFSCDGATLKSTHSLPRIEMVNGGKHEGCNKSGTDNVNHGQKYFYRRGRDKQPLVDVGVLYEGRERVMADSQIVEFTPSGRSANINPSGQTTYMTYRRASERSACNELVVSDICIIMTSRGEQAPHSYCTIDRNLNKGTMVGSDIYVCYKKSMHRSNYIAYMAGILDHYPSNHYPGFPIPTDLALFCLPMGATLESWPAKSAQPQPIFSTFVLTVTAGGGNTEAVEKVYGAAVSFYEKYPHELLTDEQREALKLNEHFGRNNIVHTNKCICILSRWPFFDTFDKFLRYLHTMANTGPHHVPIERYVHHFVECVPFPSARKPRILIQLDARERISLAQPEDLPINLSGAKFRQLVMTLRPEGCLLVLLFALTEQKILLHSLRPDVLTAVAEAITMIIFPFHWQCPYIPLCPLGLSDFLNAPIPFLLGLDSRFFDLYHPPTDVICIDLDTGAMSVPDDKKFLITKLLPRRPARILRASLESLCEKIYKFEKLLQMHLKAQKTEPGIDTDFKIKRKEQQLDVEIQEAFLRFTATILKGYSHYLLPIVSAKAGAACDTSSLFDIDAFVKSRDKNYHKFYQLMVNTQMFSKFIEERSFVSDKDASLAFFDDCAEKVVEDDTTIRLLELEPAQSEHTLFLPPPEPISLPEGMTYSYNGFPKLKPELFPLLEPKPVLPPQVKQPQATPASPLARRTKHEVKSAQKLALRHAQTPILWAKCLLSTCYSLWFTHLPAFATTQHHKARFLQLAFKILTNMQKLNLSQADEVSYRVMMQLCGLYSQPILAVKVLCEMRQHGITPNAITYGYYNRAVMESKWTHSNLFWKKLRNVVIGVAAFKRSGLERSQRRKSSLSLDEVDKCLTDADSASRVSLESGASLDSHPLHLIQRLTPSAQIQATVLSVRQVRVFFTGYVIVIYGENNCTVLSKFYDIGSHGSHLSVDSYEGMRLKTKIGAFTVINKIQTKQRMLRIWLDVVFEIVKKNCCESSSLLPVLKDSVSGSGVPPSSTSSSSFSFPPVTSCSASVTCPSPLLCSVAATTTTNTSSSPSSPPMTLPLQSVPIPSSSAQSAFPSSSSAIAANSESSQPNGDATAACGESHSSLCSHSVHSTSSSTTTSTTTTCTSATSGIPSTTESSYTSLTPSTVSMVTPSFSSSSSSSSLATIAPILSTLICPSQSSSSPSHLALTGTHTSTLMSLDPASSSSFTTTSSNSASSSSFSSSCATSRALDFSESDALRARLGSIVRSSAAGLASGADLLVIEYNVAFSSSAGLLMSSALDSTVFDAASRSRQRPNDLADALSPTLDQYDKMSEATAVRTSPEAPTSSVQDKGVPEYLRSDSYGSDAKIITNFLRLTRVDIEPIAQITQFRTSSLDAHGEEARSSPLGQNEQDFTSTEDLKGIDPIFHSNDSLSDISEEEVAQRPSSVRGFFSRNTPERLSSLFKRSVDSADEKIRGFWKRSASVSRSSSKDSVNLEQGVTDFIDRSRETSEENSSGGKSSASRSSAEAPLMPAEEDEDDKKTKKEEEEQQQEAQETEEGQLPKKLLLPPRSPNINIDRTSNYSPIPSSPMRTPVTENDPLGAFGILMTDSAPKTTETPTSLSSVAASHISDSSIRDSPSRQSVNSDDSEASSQIRGQRKPPRPVARSATFSSRSGVSMKQQVKRSANSLWALSPSPSPTHTSHSSSPNRALPHDRPQSDDPPNSALVSATPTWPSLKISFSNSSSRLGLASNMASTMATEGLRQASKQIEHLRSQYLDPAMADLGQYSPGNFNYRKNEIISGSISSVKSAVTSFSKRFGEIREAITATNTPASRGIHRTSTSLPSTSFFDNYFR
nr:uncharacterized protein LOC113814187 [Penaeus vannamei]